jgi:sugar O-acyltransferase (sialic acid O-acetyltransferase NeuD family)
MLIIGTGGLGKEVLALLIDEKEAGEICFFDENQKAPDLLYNKFKVFKSIETVTDYFRNKDNRFITAIGNPRLRKKLTEKISKAGGELTSVISSRASLFQFNEPCQGAIIQPGVGVSHGVKFGKSCAIHINASIGHSSKLGSYINIGPSATIIGPVEIGDFTYIGAQSVILPNLKIGKNVIVGAGTIVDKNLQDNQTYINQRV